MEIRELLQEYGYNAEETPVVTGSALCALEVCKRKVLPEPQAPWGGADLCSLAVNQAQVYIARPQIFS